jgi:hypothetical protein
MNGRLFLKRLLYGSAWRLNSTEQLIFHALLAALPSGEACILREQVDAIEIIQRTARDRMVLLFYSATSPPKPLPVQRDEFCVAKLEMTDGTRNGTVRIQIYNGHCRSLEFSRSPKEFSVVQITSIDLYPNPGKSLASALNRLEHGTT